LKKNEKPKSLEFIMLQSLIISYLYYILNGKGSSGKVSQDSATNGDNPGSTILDTTLDNMSINRGRDRPGSQL
jgi:hypothetical protein